MSEQHKGRVSNRQTRTNRSIPTGGKFGAAKITHEYHGIRVTKYIGYLYVNVWGYGND